MTFEAIAIVGQSCVLPGALNPQELWDAVSKGQDLTSEAPEDYWQLKKQSVLTTPDRPKQDHAWCDRGGYVHGFEKVFNPEGFQGLSADSVRGLDPLFQWVLHSGREALQSVSKLPSEDLKNAGVILGNLSYPSQKMTQLAEQHWYEDSGLSVDCGAPVDPVNRFCSGYPAHLAASALGLGGTAYAIDAACASSLYAIKLACDQLHDRKADLMLAGAVNRADDLFIHVGFCALSALSRRGRSRPFDQSADGLLPAEGAAFVVLKRLDDAIAAGQKILGVIRGVGLSNDGRVGGFLAPSEDGQLRAMRQAYEVSGVDPESVSMLECHATGTPVGDKVELQSSAEVFKGCQQLPIGSLKSNMGHLITVAGMAGVLKVLGAMEAKQKPPSINIDDALPILNETPLRVLKRLESWDSQGPRRAAVSAFGFGGNNAHIVLEEWCGQRDSLPSGHEHPKEPVAVVALDAVLPSETQDTGQDWEQFQRSLTQPQRSPSQRLDAVAVDLKGLRFPPKDLDHCLAQQILILELARAVAADFESTPKQRLSVFVGMGADPEIARYAARWRVQSRVASQDIQSRGLKNLREAFVHGLEAAGVIGTMPNIPANRINAQLNAQGPSFTVSSEQLSGLRALEIAERAVRRGELDVALVGAVDLSQEPVHTQALATHTGQAQTTADAAVVLALMRESEARKQGREILAVIESADQVSDSLLCEKALPRLGHSHAAKGLLDLASAIDQQRQCLTFDESLNVNRPLLQRRQTQSLRFEGMDQRCQWSLKPSSASLERLAIAPASHKRLWCFSGADQAEVLRALEAGEVSTDGPARLVITARDEREFEKRQDKAKAALRQSLPESSETIVKLAPGVTYGAEPMSGELAFVFPGAAAAYPGMGHEFLLAFPELGQRLLQRHPKLADAGEWLISGNQDLNHDPFKVLHGCTFLSQLHAEWSRQFVLRKPDAVLGMSSGETNSMFATEAWTDLDAMFQDLFDSGMYQQQIAGEYQTAQKYLKSTDFDWQCWQVLAPVEQVQEAVQAVHAQSENGPQSVTVTMINSDQDCVIAGLAEACQAVIERLPRASANSMDHNIVAHNPAMKHWEQPWYELHKRSTQERPGLRFYSNASGDAYEASSERIAKALTDQATAPVDFRRVVNAAWNDGVRIFIEHGPRGSCTTWIHDILGDRPHLAVALDRPAHSLDQLIDSCAYLIAAGVPIDAHALMATPETAAKAKAYVLPAHPKDVEFPAAHSSVQVIPQAPQLPSVFLDEPGRISANGVSKTPIQAALPQGSRNGSTAPQPTPRPAIVTPSAQTAAPPKPAPVQSAPAASAPTASTQAISSVQQHIGQNLMQFHQSIAAAHTQFLELQSRTGLQMLAVRQRAGQTPSSPAAHAPSFSDDELAGAPTQKLSRAQAYASLTAPTTLLPSARPMPAAQAPARPPVTAQAPKQKATVSPKVERVVEDGPLPGLKIDREGLKVLASGHISEILGPIFKQQDEYFRQVRMPEPPLLLADRVTGIEGEAGSLGKGRIWTETDVKPDAWYLHYNHMPTGIMIESGQADLLLISWLGVDFKNRGERVYRLLGCELTFHDGGLPKVGDTLKYDIRIDGYAQQGPIRLFFFHYDCNIGGRTRLSVRHGQAGFFTDEELANSAGILWKPEEHAPMPDARMDPTPIPVAKRSFTEEQVRAFAEGRLTDCFGEAFKRSLSHVRTPKVNAGQMLLMGEVEDFDPKGGPWGRGYLKSIDRLTDDEWFFDGHFKNDPCMPGTLMFEGCIQNMSFYLAAMGVTLDRDGWVFEPVPDVKYQLRCRGQVTPGARVLTYEVFVEEFIAGPIPEIQADLLCTVDGLKAFHCKGMRIRLRPAWPMESRAMILEGLKEGPIARGVDISFDYKSLASCAWGQPTHAFGGMYGVYDSHRRCPRLPGPPYHFMSRIRDLKAKTHTLKPGGIVEVDYDVPPDAWYFSENGQRSMPFCVLLEAALQPCGWLASYIGCALDQPEDVYFRNLDGTGTLYAEIKPDAGTLRTRVVSTGVSQAGPMIIVSFEVECFLGETLVYDMKTVFGFFPEESLAQQVGLPATPEELELIKNQQGRYQVLKARPKALFQCKLRLPGPMLMLLDKICEWQAEGGPDGLGHACAEIAVNADQWFFKSHFYGDPVQPGSLGIEAMLQLLQWVILEKGLADHIEAPRFEPILLNTPMTWKYRGQVLQKNKRVLVQVDLSKVESSADSVSIVAHSSYWVDGLRIYEASDIGMKVYSATEAEPCEADECLDPAVDTWLNDHCPTWTAPALAMMSMVDRLAASAKVRAPGRPVVGLKNVQVSRWLSFHKGARKLKFHGVPRLQNTVQSEILVWNEQLAEYETIARGDVLFADENFLANKAWPALEDAELQSDPYGQGVLFHGPKYQVLKEWRLGAKGSSSILTADPGQVPVGALNQVLLDGATHGIPHDRLHLWSDEISEDVVAYPVSIPEARFYGEVPTSGDIRCEVRFRGFKGGKRFPWMSIQMIEVATDRVWAEFELVEALFPKGPIGEAPAYTRRAFLRDRLFVPNLTLSSLENARQAGMKVSLTEAQVEQSNWLEGSLMRAYQTKNQLGVAFVRELLIKEACSQKFRVHPAWIQVEDHGDWARCSSEAFPFHVHDWAVHKSDEGFVAEFKSSEFLKDKVRAVWQSLLDHGPWFGEDLFLELTQTFVSSFTVVDPEAMSALKNRGVLFLGNHQVGVESLLFGILSSAVQGLPTSVIAKQEHRQSWIGRLLQVCFDRDDIENPELLALVDRADQKDVINTIAARFAAMRKDQQGLLIHVEGTRSVQGGQPIETVSSAVLDLAVQMGLTIVPVRFANALPSDSALEQRREYGVGFAAQEIFLGAPLAPETLKSMPSGERRKFVLNALNAVAGGPSHEALAAPQAELQAAVKAWAESHSVTEVEAILGHLLESCEQPCAESELVKEALSSKTFESSEQLSAEWLRHCLKNVFGIGD